jgi:hypothetical protein
VACPWRRHVSAGHVPDAFLQQVAGRYIVMQNSRLFERVRSPSATA